MNEVETQINFIYNPTHAIQQSHKKSFRHSLNKEQNFPFENVEIVLLAGCKLLSSQVT